MPTPKSKRNYKLEYKRDHSSPSDKKKRAQRNADRKKAGLKKGDKREVHHTGSGKKTRKKPLGSGTKVMSRAKNRRIGEPKRKKA